MAKITIQIASSLYDEFMKYAGPAAIRRDAFFEAVIRSELPRLEEVMKSHPQLSGAARRYVAKSLHKWVSGIPDEMKLINMSISEEIVDRLNRQVDQSKMNRDSFFNRLIMLLVSSPKLISWLTIPKDEELEEAGDDNLFHFRERAEPVSPMKAVQDLLNDPLRDHHAMAKRRWGVNLWGVPMPVDLHGLSCWIDDIHVPGTKAVEALDRLTADPDAFVRALERAFESEAQAKPANLRGNQ